MSEKISLDSSVPTHNNGIKDISMNTGIELYSKEIPIPPNPRIRMS